MADDKAKRPRHAPVACSVKSGDAFWHSSSVRRGGAWVNRYTCPFCGRQMRMPANFLGQDVLMCTGDRFWRPHEGIPADRFGSVRKEVHR